MAHPRDYLPALDRIEAALEATCGALIALESLTSGAPEHPHGADGMQEHVGRAIRSLRDAIDELRSAQGAGADGLALGFVSEGSRAAARGAPHDTGQSNPRRTA